jgi:putative sporulation protein YyaC
MLLKTSAGQQYIDVGSALAFKYFTEALHALIYKGIKSGCKSVIFVCIGTDRSTGDSLGPLIGYKISNLRYRNIVVNGNLDSPVHARNLGEVMNRISSEYGNPFIVAIDACLGKMEHVGCVTVGEGSIKPGSGVNKDLGPVGDMHITGIVNFGGFMDFLILQNTRLSTVMKMADLISTGIKHVLWKINMDPELSAFLCE